VAHAERSTSSVLGPQYAAKIRANTDTTWSTATSAGSPERTFKAGGASVSSGSINTRRFRARPGIRASRSTTRSPFGSMTTTPRPAAMSASARLASSVDLPDPVAPMTWLWKRPSSTPRQTARRGPISVTPSTRSPAPSPAISELRIVVLPSRAVLAPRARQHSRGRGDCASARVGEGGDHLVVGKMRKGGDLGEAENLATPEDAPFESPASTRAVLCDEVVAPGIDTEGGGELVGTGT
jgi:hypothetical protein